MQVIINACFGGFGLSGEACEWLIENRGWRVTDYNDDGHGYKDPTAQLVRHTSGKGPDMTRLVGSEYFLTVNRDDLAAVRENKDIIDAVLALGKKANGRCADLKIVDIPDDVKYIIEEYDGNEHIAEVHRTWE